MFVNVRVQKSVSDLSTRIIDTNKLVDYVYRQTKNQAKIVEFKYS